MQTHLTPNMSEDKPFDDPREQAVRAHPVLCVGAITRTLSDLGAQVFLGDPPVTPESIAAAKRARDAELREYQRALDAYELEKFRAMQSLERLLMKFGYSRTLDLLEMKAVQLGLLK